MEALRIHTTIRKDGELTLKGSHFKKGTAVETILIIHPPSKKKLKRLTGSMLASSSIVGLWKKRDIKNSVEYARSLRYAAEHRSHK